VRAARRAEAQKLNALGRLELERHPSATLAHAIASLELADSREARLLALAALWKGPTSFVVSPEEWSWWGEFSRDGRWLVQSIWGPPARLRLIHADGSAEELPEVHAESERVAVGVSPESDYFWSWDATPEPRPRSFALWSAPEGERLATAQFGAYAFIVRSAWGGDRTLLQVAEGRWAHVDAVGVDGSRERLGTLGFSFPEPRLWFMHTSMDIWTGRWFGAVVDNEVLVCEIGEHGLSSPRRLGRHEGPIAHVQFDPFGRFLATAGVAGDIRLWDPTGVAPPKLLQGPAGIIGINLQPDGSYLAVGAGDRTREVSGWIWSLAEDEPRLVRRLDMGPGGGNVVGDPVGRQVAKISPDYTVLLWSQAAPAAAEPITLRSGNLAWPYRRLAFHPQGRWLAATSERGLTLWPLARRYPVVIQQHDKEVWGLAFAPDGSWLASTSLDGTLRLWQLDENSPDEVQVLLDEPGVEMRGIAISPDGRQLLVPSSRGVRLLSLDGEAPRILPGFRGTFLDVAFSADGRLAAGVRSAPGRAYVWEVASGRALETPEGEGIRCFDTFVNFTPDGRLLTASQAGLRQWDLETGESEILFEDVLGLKASADGRRALLRMYAGSRFLNPMAVLDQETGVMTPLERHGDRIAGGTIDPAGEVVVTSGDDGIIRVGPVTGEEPHLLPGHQNVWALAVDPLGRWIAGAIDRTSICLWPMPDLSKPPLHTLPRGELLAKLKSLTNLRLVPDEESTTGWTLTHEAFRGWETVPSW
jgi:WD40 repeat protein